MKATLEFNLPEDKDDHVLAINAQNYALALSSYGEWLNNKLKHEELTEDVHAAFSLALVALNEACTEYEVRWC